MYLVFDVGNTNIKCALFEGRTMVSYYRMSTDKAKTSHEYGIMLYLSLIHI